MNTAEAVELEASATPAPAPLNPWLPRTPAQRREEEDITMMLEEQEEAELELLIAEMTGKGHRQIRRSFLAHKASIQGARR